MSKMIGMSFALMLKAGEGEKMVVIGPVEDVFNLVSVPRIPAKVMAAGEVLPKGVILLSKAAADPDYAKLYKTVEGKLYFFEDGGYDRYINIEEYRDGAIRVSVSYHSVYNRPVEYFKMAS